MGVKVDLVSHDGARIQGVAYGMRSFEGSDYGAVQHRFVICDILEKLFPMFVERYAKDVPDR